MNTRKGENGNAARALFLRYWPIIAVAAVKARVP